MVDAISYKHVSRVLSTWELANQKYGSREELGLEILFHVFKADPESKTVFGFKPNQNIADNPLLRMGVFVHGTRIVGMIDQVLGLLGPDSDSLIEFLATLGERHTRHHVKKSYFILMLFKKNHVIILKRIENTLEYLMYSFPWSCLFGVR